ncbi:hypothetical protein D9M69_516900 [compost metagenome]
MDVRAVAALVGLGEHAHGLAAHVAQALHIGQQLGTAHRFGEIDLDDDLAGGIRLGGIVGIRARIDRSRLAGLRARRLAAHARFAPGRRTAAGAGGASGGSRPQQGILLGRGEMGLHLAPDAPVLPPVESQHQQYQQDAEGNQPDLQITHVSIPRRNARRPSEYWFMPLRRPSSARPNLCLPQRYAKPLALAWLHRSIAWPSASRSCYAR